MREYSSSFPSLSFHFRYITEASTFAGDEVFGSFNRDITESKIVLQLKNNIRCNHDNTTKTEKFSVTAVFV